MHSTKRLYFPDLEEPSQYDKYPIVNIPIPPKKEPKTLRQLYDEFVAQKRFEQSFYDTWDKFIADRERAYGL